MLAKGLLVVMSAPSGGGKSTVIKALFQSNDEYHYSVSATTRSKRRGEIDGKDYYFIDEATFRRMIYKNELIEWEEVHGQFYGTPKKEIDEAIQNGKIVFLDIDVHGGLNIKEQFSEDVVLIFIEPPSREILKQRLENRKTETQEQIEKRLERYDLEMKNAQLYDFRVVNHTVEQAVQDIQKIINEKKGNLYND